MNPVVAKDFPSLLINSQKHDHSVMVNILISILHHINLCLTG